LEQIEEELLENPKPQSLQSIHSLKTEMYHFEGGAVARPAKNKYIFGGDINKEYADFEHNISGQWR
jgi:hypothetical protein